MSNGIADLPQKIYPNRSAKRGQAPHRRESNYVPVTLRAKFSSQISNVGDKSTKPILNLNNNRNYLIIQNNGVDDVFINFGSKANTNNLKIIAGGNYEPSIVPIDSIYLVSNAGITNECAIVEGIEPF